MDRLLQAIFMTRDIMFLNLSPMCFLGWFHSAIVYHQRTNILSKKWRSINFERTTPYAHFSGAKFPKSAIRKGEG